MEKAYKIQILVACIGAVAVIVAAIITSYSSTPSESNTELNASAYKKDFTNAKKGTLVVTPNWKQEWKNYAVIYEDFVELPTKDYIVLSSPIVSDIYEVKKENNPEVSGYLKTNKGVFYFTKYSYENPMTAKFIYPIVGLGSN